MPASLIIEGLAQTGGILVGEAGGFAEKVVLAKIPRAEFFGVACAGDQLIYEVTLTDLRSEGAVVEAKAFLDGELLADVEIVFAHLDNSRANQIFGPKNFVFTQQLLGVLDLAKAQDRAAARSRRPRTVQRADRRAVAAEPSTPADRSRSAAGSASRPSGAIAARADRRTSPTSDRRSEPTTVEIDEFLMLRSERRVVITGLGLDQPARDRSRRRLGVAGRGRRARSARSRRSPSTACPTTSAPRSADFDS